MQLDRDTCRRARLARDPRFDGRFFVAVRTTGIFCRPVCPAVSPREKNVEYFPSAAAAIAAGFRACLRCRPECAPGTPAWNGASATVARGLRLIAEGAFDESDVDALAERLGVGARHLRRLFVEHLGAPPIAVAQAQRLMSAKRLIDATDIPLTSVAIASGYRSLRRFNAAFLERYGRSPREMRRLTRTDGSRGPNSLRVSLRSARAKSKGGVRPARARGESSMRAAAPYSFQLRYRPPFNWEAMLSFLAPRVTPGVEAVGGSAYRRTVRIGDHDGWFEVRPGGRQELDLRIEFPDSSQLLRIVARVRRMFDLDADPMSIDPHLAADPLLAPLVRRRPGLRVPGAWDGFELGVRAILGQQVSVAAATSLAGRLARRFGHPLPVTDGVLTHVFPGPDEIARADASLLGVPQRRADAIIRFARAVAAGTIRLDGGIDSEELARLMIEIPGIGPWTAQYVAMRALGDPDAFPASDLGLLRACACRTASALEMRAEPWRPWRAYAALHLWTGTITTLDRISDL